MKFPKHIQPLIKDGLIHERQEQLHETDVSCANCKACCCRLEVLLITDTGIPNHFIEVDKWGGMTMEQLDDGWCVALDRNTMLCTIYEKRPLVCREYKMGDTDCIIERTASL